MNMHGHDHSGHFMNGNPSHMPAMGHDMHMEGCSMNVHKNEIIIDR